MPTPPQAQDLVDWAGGIRAAGRAVGFAPSSIRRWLRPEDYRALGRRCYERKDGLAYNHLLLRHRRNKALGRMAERNRPKEAI